MASYTTYGMGRSRSSTLVRLRSVHEPDQLLVAQSARAAVCPAQPALAASPSAPNIAAAPSTRACETSRVDTHGGYHQSRDRRSRARVQRMFPAGCSRNRRAFASTRWQLRAGCNGSATEGTWWWGEGVLLGRAHRD